MKKLQFEPIIKGVPGREYNAIKYSQSVAEKQRRLSKSDRQLRSLLIFALAILIVGLSMLYMQNGYIINASDTTTVKSEQKYIVKHGYTMMYEGNMVINTNDGDVWTITDAPEYELGTEVRVLFDSKGTKDQCDDEVIDITELKEGR